MTVTDTSGGEAPVLAIDIGGTKMAVGAVDERGAVLAAYRTPTPTAPDVDSEALYATLLDAIDHLPYGRDAYRAVGVGCGGPMRWPAGEVSPLNIPGWRGFPLRWRLETDFRREVRLHN